VQQRAQGFEMIIAAPAATDRLRQEPERWPAPASAAFVVGVSLALWGGIYLAASALFF
jgi:hypothetical protein